MIGLALLLNGCATTRAADNMISKWERFETSFQSSIDYTNAIQQANLDVTFTSMLGETRTVPGFWDGGKTWRVRFSPNQIGKWTWETACSDPDNGGLHEQKGEFLCTPPLERTVFQQHGPIRVSPDGRYLMHEDRTPFFFLSDTAWNGALLATPGEWDSYIKTRNGQNFTAVQWVATQWRAAPDGDRFGDNAYSGTNQIRINPQFFQRLDDKVEALNEAGLLNVPVMLWAIGGGSNPRVNPGFSLSEDQAILLARYMFARWHANDVLWLLPGDSDYRGEKAERWKGIGRAVFGEHPEAVVTLHPGGMQWYWNEFKDEKWVDVISYQSGHGDDAKTWEWLNQGPPTTDWTKLPHRPFINLEPPYENHIAYQSGEPHSADSIRRAVYWSLLTVPTAGVSYGGHGVWGWDDGTRPPTDHPRTGTPLPWKKALLMPGAQQMALVYDFFTSLDFWRLRPAPYMVVNQPGAQEPDRYIAAARTDKKDLAIIYVPRDRTVEIKLDTLPPSPNIGWINPRTGEKSPAVAVVTANTCQFPTPSEGDWLLVMRSDPKPADADMSKDAASPAPKEQPQ